VESGVPFTMMTAPDGKILYRKVCEAAILDIRRAILGALPDPDYIGHRTYWEGTP